MTYEDNILYVDIENFEYRLMLTIKHHKRVRLLLGKIYPSEFEVTVDTINNLPDEKQIEVRNYIRSIFKT